MKRTLKNSSCHESVIACFIVALLVLSTSFLVAQPKYRAFSQVDLADKKANKEGKSIGSYVWFTFHNTLTIPVTSLHAKFTSEIESVTDSGGFTTISVDGKSRLNASGRSVVPGDSVTLCFIFHKKEKKTKAEKWWWDTSGVQVGPVFRQLLPDTTVIIFGQPNGGTVREYLYKHIIHRPNGLLVGLPTSTPDVGWIRYKTADRKYFPHTDNARCLDSVAVGDNGAKRRLIGELKNPHVKKHNNHLLGEIHALTLAVIANDSGVTEPDPPANRLGDLIYNDGSNPGDPCNGKTIRQALYLIDSALTYCGNFVASDYYNFDSCVSRINRAFSGPYVAVSFHPLIIAGTNTLPPFLHPNPSASPVTIYRHDFSDETPDRYTLAQNYPNPFNPTTTIEFQLVEPSIVTLKVYNMLGQEVATLVNKETMEDGEQSIDFDAASLSSGIYFYRIVAQSVGDSKQVFQSVKRMILLK